MRRGGSWAARSALRSGKARKLIFKAKRLNAHSFPDPQPTGYPGTVGSLHANIHYPNVARGAPARIMQPATVARKLSVFEEQTRFWEVGYLLRLCLTPALSRARHAVDVLVVKREVEPPARGRKE